MFSRTKKKKFYFKAFEGYHDIVAWDTSGTKEEYPLSIKPTEVGGQNCF